MHEIFLAPRLPLNFLAQRERALHIYIFLVSAGLIDTKMGIFYVDHLKQPTQKISIFIGRLRQTTPKIKVYF
jgi:hypothetical protein